jgi:hypothetical protein
MNLTRFSDFLASVMPETPLLTMIFLQGSCFYLPITSSEIQKVSQKVISSGCATIQLKLSIAYYDNG